MSDRKKRSQMSDRKINFSVRSETYDVGCSKCGGISKKLPPLFKSIVE